MVQLKFYWITHNTFSYFPLLKPPFPPFSHIFTPTISINLWNRSLFKGKKNKLLLHIVHSQGNKKTRKNFLPSLKWHKRYIEGVSGREKRKINWTWKLSTAVCVCLWENVYVIYALTHDNDLDIWRQRKNINIYGKYKKEMEKKKLYCAVLCCACYLISKWFHRRL